MNDVLLSTVLLLFCILTGFFFGWVVFASDSINISNRDWKCKQAIIIDDDPSRTECVIYARKDHP